MPASGWVTRIAVTAATVGATWLAAAPVAHAAPDQQSMFMDDSELLYRGADHTDAVLGELQELGVDVVRVSVHWRAIAPDHRARERPARLDDPSDPDEYDPGVFDNLDHLLRVARRLGIDVLFNVTGGAPIWATGRRGGKPVSLQYKPSPNGFQRFMEMLGRRYDGTWRDENQGGGLVPRVELWSIWNEPNQGALLQPQWERAGAKGPWRPYAPRLYRRLVRAAVQGLGRTGHARDTILLGETAPLGSRQKGTKRSLAPGLFLRELLCLDRNLHAITGAAAARRNCDFGARGPLPVAGYAHHPYSIKNPPATPDPNPDHMTLSGGDRLEEVLDAGAEIARIPAGLRLWYTEYGYQTLPPDPVRGVALEEQAAWSSEAERLTWQDPRIAAHTQFLMRDDLPRRQYPVNHPRHWGTYQTGLEFANGARKPAYEAYRLPFYAPNTVVPGEPLRLWGFVRAGVNGVAQHVTVEFQADGDEEFKALFQMRVDDPRGYFETTVSPPGDGRWRFRWDPAGDEGGTLTPQVPGTGPGPSRAVYFSQALPVRIG